MLSDATMLHRSAAAGALYALVANHVVHGRVIFPGAGYLELARAASCSAEVPVALSEAFFVLPLEVQGTDLHVECSIVDNRFEVSSGYLGGTGSLLGSATHCSGSISFQPTWHHIHHALIRGGWCCVSAAALRALYDSFHAAGLQYGPGYRTLQQAWVGADVATARLTGRSFWQGTEVHPADLDDALCVGGIVACSSEARLPFAVDTAQLKGVSGELWAVRHA